MRSPNTITMTDALTNCISANPATQIKYLCVGPGQSGKSTLLRALKGENPHTASESEPTHRQIIVDQPAGYTILSVLEAPAGPISNESLAAADRVIITMDLTQPISQAMLREYTEAIKTLRRDMPILVVGTKAEVATYKPHALNPSFIEVSAWNGWNMPLLRTLLAAPHWTF